MQEQEELFEAAILFTDMRGSAELITSTGTREFFRLLNASLSAQSDLVRKHGGEVLKYTGDGLMAVFRGDDRARGALHCACELADPALSADTPFGIGVAEGRVLAGIVGNAPDVIGATVHLAARLCSMAEAGEVVATQRVANASGLSLPMRDIGPLRVRGFASAIDCVSIVHPLAAPCTDALPP
jgi:adenylate cyclase